MSSPRRWNRELKLFEKQCGKCGEWWPLTAEFWQKKHNTPYLAGPCKSCIDEKRMETNLSKPCCVPGCNEPRWGWRYSRCEKHHREIAATWRSRKANPDAKGATV